MNGTPANRLAMTLVAGLVLNLAACCQQTPQSMGDAGSSADDGAGWGALFDGKTLKGWKRTEFGGDKAPYVQNGMLVIPTGEVLSGATYTGKLPTTNYEIDVEVQRINGLDFFCGLTFPHKESNASLIIGGWGGGVCGISSIDGLDASENETTQFLSFDSKVWYTVRLRVWEDKFEAWLSYDEKNEETKKNERVIIKLVDVNVKDRKVDVRPEVELSKPFGFSAFQTTAGLRSIRMRKLDPKKPKEGAPKENRDP